MSDVIPQSDGDFDTLMNQFIPYVAGHATNLGVPTAMATALTSELELWTDSFADHQAKQTAALAATGVKDQTRATLTTQARAAIRIIQNNPAVTDEQRQSMGLPVHDDKRTRVPVPTTRPVVQIESLEHLEHVVNFRDESKPKSKAKPAGVRGAEIWIWIGPNPPADPAGFRWVALDSATPYLMVHEGADVGKTACYALRWENTRGEPGPWSDVVSATIQG